MHSIHTQNHRTRAHAVRGFAGLLCIVALTSAGLAQGPVVFRQHAVQLPAERPITAFTILVPEGWEIEGGMQRTPPELSNMFTLTDLEVRAPDGRSIHFYPGMSFTYSDLTQARHLQPMGGYFYLPPPRTISEWILYMNQLSPDPAITDLRVVSDVAMPEWVKSLDRLYGDQIREMRQVGNAPGVQTFADLYAAKAVFSYKRDGKPMEETFLVAWRVSVMRVDGRVGNCNWAIIDMRSVAGPAGSDYTNDPALITINHSLRHTPEFFEAMHAYYQRLFRRPPPRNVAGMKQDSESVSDIIHNGWKKRSGMTDAGQQREVDMIHERAPYNTADGRTVHLSSHYDRVFSDGDRYILTNDANWDPRTDSRFNQGQWQPLERQRY